MSPRTHTRRPINRSGCNKEVRISQKRSTPEKIGTKRSLQTEVNDYLLQLIGSTIQVDVSYGRLPESMHPVRVLEVVQVPKKPIAKQHLYDKLIHGKKLDEMRDMVDSRANPKGKEGVAHISGIVVVRKRLVKLLVEGDILISERQAQADYFAEECDMASAAKIQETDQAGIIVARSNHNMNPQEILTVIDGIGGALHKGFGPSPAIPLADWQVYPNLSYWQK